MPEILNSVQHLSRRLRALAELESHLSFRISRLSKLLDVQASNILSGSGYGLTSYRILLVLSIFKETTPADMSRLMVIDKAQISRATAELERNNLISARPDPANARRKLLRLTDAGIAAIDMLEARFGNRQERLVGTLDPGDLEGLTAAIDKLSAYLAEDTHQPDAAPSGQAAKD
jgi:DNA-binding MarR family transcriptional regulator